MGFVRFRLKSSPAEWGHLDGNTITRMSLCGEEDVSALPARDEFHLVVDSETDELDLDNVEILSPVHSGNIYRLDGCYEQDLSEPTRHLEGSGIIDRNHPSLWVAPSSTVTAHGADVPIPSSVEDIHIGVELGLVVGEAARNLVPEEALDVISGYTICRSLYVHDEYPGLYGYKMFPGFLGVGPEVASTIEEPAALGVLCNNRPLDARSTIDRRFSLGELVSYVSEVSTLAPGDLIVTGDPTRSSVSLEAGDTVSAWIEGIGSCETTLTRKVDT